MYAPRDVLFCTSAQCYRIVRSLLRTLVFFLQIFQLVNFISRFVQSELDFSKILEHCSSPRIFHRLSTITISKTVRRRRGWNALNNRVSALNGRLYEMSISVGHSRTLLSKKKIEEPGKPTKQSSSIVGTIVSSSTDLRTTFVEMVGLVKFSPDA